MKKVLNEIEVYFLKMNTDQGCYEVAIFEPQDDPLPLSEFMDAAISLGELEEISCIVDINGAIDILTEYSITFLED
jgi:hypothetical protein